MKSYFCAGLQGVKHLKKRSIEEKDTEDKAIFTTTKATHSIGDILHSFGLTTFIVIMLIGGLTIITLFLFIFALIVLIVWGKSQRRKHCQ